MSLLVVLKRNKYVEFCLENIWTSRLSAQIYSFAEACVSLSSFGTYYFGRDKFFRANFKVTKRYEKSIVSIRCAPIPND
jgi:hypothetical protein